MAGTTPVTQLPAFLQSFENLSAHFEEHFDDLSNPDRGERFVDFVLRLVPLTDEGGSFSGLVRSEKVSHDDGVDLLTGTNDGGDRLYVQSKYRIRTKDELDTIVSKFHNYEDLLSKEQAPKLDLYPETGSTAPTSVYMIVTSSKLAGIVDRYEHSQLASRAFYQLLVDAGRLHVIDGTAILTRLQGLYQTSYLLPAELRLRSPDKWLVRGGVWIGMLAAEDVSAMYGQYGGALFFENIRDFLGVSSGKKPQDDRESVNAKIIDTIRNQPTKMLERNNGLTFRAESIVRVDDETIVASGGAIVNGCQTTMCVVHCRGELSDDCLVPVKVVQTADVDDAWEIARAANYQNPVRQIDLDLARYLRPQLVQRAASDHGYAMGAQSDESITSVLASIYRNAVDYEELKSLYIGLFSRVPNNLFEDNYTDLRIDVLESLYKPLGDHEERIFETLFLVLTAARSALKECEELYSDSEYPLFKRLNQRSKYRAYLAVLALCGQLNENLSQRSSVGAVEADRMNELLRKTRQLLENEPDGYIDAYIGAYQTMADVALQAWGADAHESQVLQEMNKRVSRMAFGALYQSLRMKLAASERQRKRWEVGSAGAKERRAK